MNAFHKKCLDNILHMKYRDEITNVEILRTGQEEINGNAKNKKAKVIGLRMSDEGY